ncbi:MAG TPA: histidine phosphatase family protein [Jatrophihabitantaceae bacterium]|jgi:probable phosphoglycerate mutase|nr:histidine phosphatase family protein [Jatrophihabitantaceae bacterium]
MRVLLLRHGRTAWNAERRYQGQADPPLDEVGRRQAVEVAGLVAALEPQLLVSSDALRARQTAEPIGVVTGLEVRVDARLRERSLGHWEGLTRDEVAERYPDEFADWLAGRDVSRRGGESRDEVATRALAAFAELPDVETAVLVTHSATAMALCNALIGIDQAVHVLGPLANCHWSELTAAPAGSSARWRLRAHNIGAPGIVAPLPVPLGQADDAPDADA